MFPRAKLVGYGGVQRHGCVRGYVMRLQGTLPRVLSCPFGSMLHAALRPRQRVHGRVPDMGEAPCIVHSPTPGLGAQTASALWALGSTAEPALRAARD